MSPASEVVLGLDYQLCEYVKHLKQERRERRYAIVLCYTD